MLFFIKNRWNVHSLSENNYLNFYFLTPFREWSTGELCCAVHFSNGQAHLGGMTASLIFPYSLVLKTCLILEPAYFNCIQTYK